MPRRWPASCYRPWPAPISWENQLVITASIGIALYPDNGLDANMLIGNADAAMYLAKENDRNNCQFYSPDLNEKNLERLQLELRLRHALEADEFVLYFQPQIDAQSGALVGAETLIRWRDPIHGLIPPAVSFRWPKRRVDPAHRRLGAARGVPPATPLAGA